MGGQTRRTLDCRRDGDHGQLTEGERAELVRLRKENAALAMERDALKRSLAGQGRGNPGLTGMPPGSPHDALFVKACGYIDRHLGDAPLRPRSVADAHHVSLRTLQLIFAERGETVSGRIRRLRLERCQADIAHGGTPIASIALRWGFADAAHFSRVFKNRYGMSPREARAAIMSGVAGDARALTVLPARPLSPDRRPGVRIDRPAS